MDLSNNEINDSAEYLQNELVAAEEEEEEEDYQIEEEQEQLTLFDF